MHAFEDVIPMVDHRICSDIYGPTAEMKGIEGQPYMISYGLQHVPIL
jgi:hypothetical protein